MGQETKGESRGTGLDVGKGVTISLLLITKGCLGHCFSGGHGAHWLWQIHDKGGPGLHHKPSVSYTEHPVFMSRHNKCCWLEGIFAVKLQTEGGEISLSSLKCKCLLHFSFFLNGQNSAFSSILLLT